MQHYVNCHAAPGGNGTKEAPFCRIQEAAAVATAGDEVIVAPGVYREHVDPQNGGTEEARIVYRSEVPLGAVIKGSEEVKGWTQITAGSDVWTVRVPNSMFKEENPFTRRIEGDWYIPTWGHHTGEIYLNGKSMYEVSSLAEVKDPKPSPMSWEQAFSTYAWYTEQDGDETVLWANFHGADPNAEKVEITARRFCFYPLREGVGCITLSGFTVTQAATQWAPPTAYQEGMIGPHWSKGWIIEDCEVSESKCSGISLGKYLQPENDNKWLKWKYKDGTQTERDCICQAQREGWTKERIGSHIVRRCHIHDCGQTGIVGHLGGVFSLIEDNHIHHVNIKGNLMGAETGGIKMHAAIDVIFRHNHIHHCGRGLWLDWQAQGTRVTGNVFHDNTLPFDESLTPEGAFGLGEDIFVEVSHGPTLIDNNLLLSDTSLRLSTQGVALVHNLIAGALSAVGKGVDNGSIEKPSVRYTPYHVPHRTEVNGFMTILHGDMRFYNNIFYQKPIRPAMKALQEALGSDDGWLDLNMTVGTSRYDGYMTEEEWKAQFEGWCGMMAPPSDRYYNPLPVWTGGNVFVNGAKPCDKEANFQTLDTPSTCLALVEKEDGLWLDTDLYQIWDNAAAAGVKVNTDVLGMAFEPEERYENPDGTPIDFDEDLKGESRDGKVLPGPFARMPEGGMIRLEGIPA